MASIHLPDGIQWGLVTEATMTQTQTDIYYQAMLARDPRFDGRFFAGVRTTGIYCRPICPARKPRRTSVVFFPSAAAAEAGGFRPCRRCRPDTAPGTPVWTGTAATVSRALKLLAAGAATDGLPALAARVGIGPRQLRHLFRRHLGASPRDVARVLRLDFARRLIDETTLPMTDIAFSAGFSSVRRFNDAVKSRFGRPPTELRRQADDLTGSTDDALVLRLPYRPPFDWASLLAFLGRRAVTGVESVSGTVYRRTIRLGAASGWVSVEPDPHRHELRAMVRLPRRERLMEVSARLRDLFDLEADPLRIGEDLGRDPALAPWVAAWPGLRVPGTWDGFEAAVRAVLGQGVSVAAATTFCTRLAQRCGPPVAGAPAGLTRCFPTPAEVAGADIHDLGLTRSRAAALKQLATAVAGDEIRLDGSADPVHVRHQLVRIPGIGDWTAEYIALRALHDPDAFPATDLVVARTLDRWPRLSGDGDPAALWRPWRAYATMFLWRIAATGADPAHPPEGDPS